MHAAKKMLVSGSNNAIEPRAELPDGVDTAAAQNLGPGVPFVADVIRITSYGDQIGRAHV